MKLTAVSAQRLESLPHKDVMANVLPTYSTALVSNPVSSRQ